MQQKGGPHKSSSTNPFDDSFDDEDNPNDGGNNNNNNNNKNILDEEHELIFHDAQQDEHGQQEGEQEQEQDAPPPPPSRGAQRLAPLNFDKPFDDVEDPALKFDQQNNRKLSYDFVSPLENTMTQLGTHPRGRSSPTKDTGYSTFANYHNNANVAQHPPLEEKNYDYGGGCADDDYDEITEGSALLLQSTGASSSNQRGIIASSSSPGRSPGRRRIPTEISTGGSLVSSQRQSSASNSNNINSKINHRTRRRSSVHPGSKNMLLKELGSGEHEFTMDYKYILLEDLGTASSWLILLLPYVAFFLALLLESSRSLKVFTRDPLVANTSCVVMGGGGLLVEGSRIPTAPCHTSFQGRRIVDQGHYDYNVMSLVGNYNNSNNNNNNNKTFLDDYSGTVFDSGILSSMPVLSTYLYGDVSFQGLTSETVAMVSRGLVESSVVVLQQQPNIKEANGVVISSSDGRSNYNNNSTHDSQRQDWTIMFTSTPKSLTMACERTTDEDISLWDCKTPQLIDVVFSMPDAAVYAAGNLRVNVYYSLKNNNSNNDSADQPQQISNYSSPQIKLDESNKTQQVLLDDRSSAQNDPLTTSTISAFETVRVYTNRKRDYLEIASTKILEPANLLLEELVSHSTYTLEHMSDLAMNLDTAVRLTTFTISFWFVIYWCYSMGIHGWCRRAWCRRGSQHRTNDQDVLWWESPWILFPERWYIMVLLFSLLLMQEPVLAVMTFRPSLGASTRAHVAADATIGIGVQGVLFVYLCLFRGLPFHTAAITKRRTDHQRKMMQLRRAAKYVVQGAEHHPSSPTEEGITNYVKDYFDRFGDIDGSASAAFLRLPNDPCSDGWADFLLFKLLLLVFGVASVVGTAYCRFPPDGDDVIPLSDFAIHQYKLAYIICVIVQFLSLLVWMFLVIIAAIDAGRKLRKEPFLGTRPVQLAYRILFAHVSLGFTVLTVSFFKNLSQILKKWSLANPSRSQIHTVLHDDDEETSKLELVIRVLTAVAKQFPYSGTAASVGSGKILFATVSILITAFIFLPAHILDEEEDDDQYIETWGTSRTTLNDKFREQRRLRRDKRLVVNLARDSKTWRVFPLPIKQSAVSTTMLQDHVFQMYKDLHTDGNTKGRGVVSIGPYTPVFCLEIACWLNEASWQAYYSPAGIVPNDSNIATGMQLEGLGLHLEGAIYDESTDTQAYVATNVAAQVDGEEDSVIVVAFRGSTSSTNLQTDLKSRQVPLLDQLTGIGSAPFCIFPDRVDVYDDDGWIWDTPEPRIKESVQCVTSWTSPKPSCVPSRYTREEEISKLAAVSKGARMLLQATPVARSSFPLVHEGFQEVYTHIRRKLLDILFPVIQRQLERAMEEEATSGKKEREPLALPKIYCTGHSLGGSLAQLLALDLANNCEIVIPTQLNSNLERFYDAETGGKPSKWQCTGDNNDLRLQPPIAVYTFGQPRVGNKTFSRLFKQRVPHSFRVVNEGDAITSMPNYLFCGGLYKHSGLEVLLDEGQTGNILVGPTVVETLFRFHKVRTSVLAHTMQRYRDCLECAFSEDELVEYYRGHNLVVKGTNDRNEEVVVPADIPAWMTKRGI